MSLSRLEVLHHVLDEIRFVEEQIEEEESALAVVTKLEMIGESKNSLYLFDRDMGKRAAK